MHRKSPAVIIHTSPKSVEIVALHRKPSKTMAAAISQFNKFVRDGRLGSIRISPDGIVRPPVDAANLTAEQQKIVRRVAVFLQEPMGRRMRYHASMPEPERIHSGITRRMQEFERRGEFLWMHPSVEQAILEGQSAEKLIESVEQHNRVYLWGLREKLGGLGSPESVKANLRKQPIFFRQLLRDKNASELSIDKDLGRADEQETKVVLTRDGTVFRHIVSYVRSLNLADHFIVELTPAGKINIHIYDEKMRE